MATSGNSLQESAKETARAKLSEQQQAAAGGLGEFAGALRKSAGEMQGGDGELAGRLAQTAAEKLEQVAETLRHKDLDSVVRDAERFAREQPVVFLSAAVAVGFLAVRFLKSSKPTASSATSTSGSYGTAGSTSGSYGTTGSTSGSYGSAGSTSGGSFNPQI